MLPHVDCLKPAVFAFYSDVIFWNDGGAPAIWHVTITEYVVIALLRFLTDARDGEAGFTCVDSGMDGNGRGVLVPRPSGVRREVNDIGLLEIIRDSGFDPVARLISYNRSSELDWAWAEPAQK